MHLKGAGNNESFYGRWTGAFILDRPLRITFTLSSGTGARLFSDDKTVIDLGVTGNGSEKTESVNLERGEHHLKVDAVRRVVNHWCTLHWQVEGYARSPVPMAEPFKTATRTDDKGEFRFAELPPGRYRVRGQVPGEYVYAKALSDGLLTPSLSPSAGEGVRRTGEGDRSSSGSDGASHSVDCAPGPRDGGRREEGTRRRL